MSEAAAFGSELPNESEPALDPYATYPDRRGRRLPDTVHGELPTNFRVFDYWKVLTRDGSRPRTALHEGKLTEECWMVVAPMSYGYALGNLEKHTVREHEDGTITVAPGDGSSNSILITGHGGEQYHGYIERGVWT